MRSSWWQRPRRDDLAAAKFTRFASGLHEVLGLAYRDGWLYVTQRGELSRIKDSDGDGKADVFETVSDAWEINGDYHEYAFGSKFDREGYLWVALCLTGSFTSENKFRGWGLRISPEGKTIPSCSGIRSPGGIGMNAAGDFFYSENQGPWNGACSLKQLKPGHFLGNPSGNRWYSEAPALGPRRPTRPAAAGWRPRPSGSPSCYRPRSTSPIPRWVSRPAASPATPPGASSDRSRTSSSSADNSASTINRVVLEVVGGRYQGACIPFRQGFASGNLPLLFSPGGTLFVGETNRGWGSRGSQPFALQRLDWTGKVPFEVETIHARPDGFELTFTEPVDAAAAGAVTSYAMTTYTYIYQSSYGSPKVDETEPTVMKATVAPDGRSVRLVLSALAEGHVHELHLPGVRSAGGKPLLHPIAYYTLNRDPGSLASTVWGDSAEAISARLLNCHQRHAMMSPVRPRPSAAGRGPCFRPDDGDELGALTVRGPWR